MPWLALLLSCKTEPPPTGPDAPTAEDTGAPTPGGVCADRPGESFCDGRDAVSCDASGEVASREACAEGCSAGECVSCSVALSATFSAPSAAGGVVVEADPDLHPARARELVVEGAGAVSLDGPFSLARRDGSPVAPGDPVADEALWLSASEPGSGSISVSAPGCDTGASLPLTALAPVPLAGTALVDAPWFDDAHDLFLGDAPAEILVDPERLADRVGLGFRVRLVPDRDAEAWAADPRLDDAVADAQGTVDGAAVSLALPPTPAGELLRAYDVVVDFGDDGRLDPGDLLDGLHGPALQVAGDLSAPGPYTPRSSLEQGPGQWIRQKIYAPAEVDQLDPLPLVVISHGNGHEYTWYDWLGEHLASWGYVVMAHANNTVPGPQSAARTTLSNTDWLVSNLGTALGGALDGEVDPHRVVWIGHSRGGEGIVQAYHDLFQGTADVDTLAASDVVLLSSIAPTIFADPNQANPHGVPFHILSGSADGDVTGGVDVILVQYYRMFQRHTGLGLVTYLHGADHNDFNCCGIEDAALVPASDRGPLIGRQEAQRLGRWYYLATLQALLGGQEVLWEVDSRAPQGFRPPGLQQPVATQLKRAEGDRKVVVDDFQTAPELGLSSSGGQVQGQVREPAEEAMDDRDNQLTWSASDPMSGMTWSHNDPDPARGLAFTWEDGDDASVAFELPPDATDLRDASFVSLRIAQQSRHPNVVDPMLWFSVALVDAAGHASVVRADAWGGANAPYARGGTGAGVGWVNEFQTVRVPVSAFARDPLLDLSDVATLELRFGAASGAPHGRAAVDDVELLWGSSP